MLVHLRHVVILSVLVFSLPTVAWGVNRVSWSVALSTTGEDVFWTSPTAVTLGFPEYDWSYEITKLTAKVTLLGNQSLLDSLDETSGGGTATMLPVVVVDSALEEPTTGSSANIFIEIDDKGFGRASGTNIHLGSFTIFQIQRVDLEATISVTGIPAGDYNRDGEVGAEDYEVWKSSFGSTADLNADGNHDHVVDAADFTLWRDAFSSVGGFGPTVAVPESSTIVLLTMLAPALVDLRRRRSPRD